MKGPIIDYWIDRPPSWCRTPSVRRRLVTLAVAVLAMVLIGFF